MSTPNPAQRELVFCHECENEFWRDEHGLVCPACSSDFTEVIESSHDPHAPASPPSIFSESLRNHNPWGNAAEAAPDPDEDDVRRYEYHSPGGGFHFSSTFIQTGGPRRGQTRSEGGDPNDEHAPATPFGLLGHMLATMARPQNYPQHQHPESSPLGSSPFPGQPRSTDGTGRPQTHFYTTNGPNIMFSTTANPGNMRPTDDGMPHTELHQMLGNLFGSFGGPIGPGGRGGGGDFQALLQAVLNPANARHGDAVYSNEAFDRVLSQFMDEHTTSNAPGPASEAAIDALPRKPAGPHELGDEGKAECSICMDSVAAGDELCVLPCSHWFHPDCVKAWLGEHDTCPVCRAGIMPKDGDQSRARTADQQPMHNEDPSLVARRQSGTQSHPFIVPESPSRERRTPNFRRHSSNSGLPGAFPSDEDSSGRQQGSSSSGGLSGRMRSLFGGGNSGAGNSSSNPSSSSKRDADQ